MHSTRTTGIALLLAAAVAAGPTAVQPSPQLRPMLHAHNCYPEDGQWTDRIERALGTRVSPIAIEQDLVWSASTGQIMVSHGTPLTGKEPTLEEYFFKRVAPILDGL